MLWYLRTCPPQTSPVSLLGVTVSLSGVPVTGAQEGGGVQERGSQKPAPRPRASQISHNLMGVGVGCGGWGWGAVPGAEGRGGQRVWKGRRH